MDNIDLKFEVRVCSESITKEEFFSILPKLPPDLIQEGYDLSLNMSVDDLGVIYNNCKDFRRGVRGSELIAVLLYKLRGLSGVRNERYYRDVIHRIYGGKTEVVCAMGRVDLMVNIGVRPFILEFKFWDCYKAALGQILCYGDYFPGYSKGLVLLGEPKRGVLVDFKRICNDLDVVLFQFEGEDIFIV